MSALSSTTIGAGGAAEPGPSARLWVRALMKVGNLNRIGRARAFQGGQLEGVMVGLSLPPGSDKLLARETSLPRLDGCSSGCDSELRRNGSRSTIAAAGHGHERT